MSATGTNDDWKVLPHEPLTKISARVWRTEGSLDGGPPIKRVMVIARRADGDLVVHSAMALDEENMAKLDALGPVKWIVVPNGFHRMDAPRFAKRYPNAKVICPAGAKKKVEAVVKVDGTYADFPPDDHVSFVTLRGVGDREGAMIVRDEDGVSIALADVAFNMPHQSGFSGFVLRHLFSSSGGPRVSRIAKLFIIKNRKDTADHLRELAEMKGLTRVMFGHHEMVDKDPAGALRTAADTLAPPSPPS